MPPLQRFHSHSNGWTLIEVLVALVLIASISALGYRGISTLLTTEAHIREESERLVALDSAFSQMDADWTTQRARLTAPPRVITHDTPPEEINNPSSASTEDTKQWYVTPINGWIPSRVLLRAPPALEPYLYRRYSLEYQAHPQGGVERSVGCIPLPGSQASLPGLPCQRWHLLRGLPTQIEENAGTTQQGKTVRWIVKTPQGLVERFWALPPVAPPTM